MHVIAYIHVHVHALQCIQHDEKVAAGAGAEIGTADEKNNLINLIENVNACLAK